MKLLLTIVQGPESGKRFEFESPGRYLVGRDSAADARLSLDVYASERQLLLELDKDRCVLLDLGGPNPSRINGAVARRAELHDNDVVQAGATRFRIRLTNIPVCFWCGQPSEEIRERYDADGHHAELSGAAVYACEKHVPRDESCGGYLVTPQAMVVANPGATSHAYVSYKILGRGAYGEVHLVYDATTARVWVVKRATGVFDLITERRFDRREVEILRAVRHPNIVRCVGAGVDGEGVHFLISEYVGGGDLHGLLDSAGTLKPPRALRMLREMLDALVYLQEGPRKIVHRDIKPANILLSKADSGHAVSKLADFGMAKSFGDMQATWLTHPGEFVGTPYYAAPEALRFGAAQDAGFLPELDVYSLGATFYRALTGFYPFNFPESGGMAAWVYHVNEHQSVPILRRNPAVPRGLAVVIDHACQKEPSKRFRDAAEFREALPDKL